MNPLLQREREYPFARLLEIKRAREADGRHVLDFGMGDPRDPTPAFIRQTLAEAVPEISSYPTVKGKPELRKKVLARVQAARKQHVNVLVLRARRSGGAAVTWVRSLRRVKFGPKK